jgi:hypothetical protein
MRMPRQLKPALTRAGNIEPEELPHRTSMPPATTMTPDPAKPADAPRRPSVAAPQPVGPQPPQHREPTDYTGWYVSSLDLRQGLSVVDLDDPDLHRLFR